ncbi:MAG: tetratricopeptide (TPR) repeat protein [Alteromonadaceae bacterium]|jgi:tetratricopeptide (TPR) repeat protein
MMKYLLLNLLIVSGFVQAELEIKLVKPKLLLQQISASELGIKPVINENERQYSSLIAEMLKAKKYQVLLDELSNKLHDQLAAEQVSTAMAYLVGQLALQQEKYQMAKRYFKQTIKQQPDYAKAYHGLGLVQLKLQQYDKANHNLSKALQLGINDPQLYSYLGYGYIQTSNFHSAVVAYQQAKLFNPNDQQLNQALLYAYSQAGQSEAALSLLTQMLVKQPNASALWLHRANALLQTKNYPLVISSLETALRLGDTGTDNIALTAQLQMQYGSVDRAIELYQKIWQQHNKPQLVLDAIEYLISMDQLISANNWLERMNSTSSINNQQKSQLSYLKGKVSQQQGKLDIAETAFEQALNENAINGNALLAAAQVKRAQGKSHQAQMLLLRASSVDSVKLSALTEHADLMMSLGRYGKALEFLQQALAHAPYESTIIENVQTLQRLVNQSES